MLPCLTLYGDVIGMLGGFVYNIMIMGVNSSIYLKNTLLYFELWDLITGLIKASIFGLIIALVGCWQGLKAEGGAAGVGRATTRSVVISSIVILMVNFFLSKVLPASLSQ